MIAFRPRTSTAPGCPRPKLTSHAGGRVWQCVAGAPPAPAGSRAKLAIRLADVMRSEGFSALGIEASRTTGSDSRYVRGVDRWARVWVLRISDHRSAARTLLQGHRRHPRPHFHLVTLDGVSGFDVAAGWLRDCWAGEWPWANPFSRASLC